MSDKFNVSTCIYCGDIGKDRHHYKESVANSGRKRSYKKDEVLPTCRECNTFHYHEDQLDTVICQKCKTKFQTYTKGNS